MRWPGCCASAAGIAPEDLAPASLALTLAALAAALGAARVRRSRGPWLGGGLALMAAAGIAAWHPGLLVPALALVPAVVVSVLVAAYMEARLPASMDERVPIPSKRALALGALAVLAVLQTARLGTYITNPESDWFLSTRHPFYAKHECMNAYVYAAELDRRGEPNVYDAVHYPGLNPAAEPSTELAGMSPEDPFQYPPQFLLLPRLAIELTDDYAAIRSVWFGVNFLLCVGAVAALARWVAGRHGAWAALLAPALLASFPFLHDLQYGQFHFAAVALAVLGLVAVQRRRPAVGGAFLSVAILAKLFPAILLVPLAISSRWRALGWTAVVGAGITALALAVLGPASFEAFFTYHLPRLADGRAFAFGEAWPEVAGLLVAGNQGVQGVLHKIAALAGGAVDPVLARLVGNAFLLTLAVLAAFVGARSKSSSRAVQAAGWLGLLGLGSLASPGAWADYVPVTCVWLLTLLASFAWGRPILAGALAVCGVLQFFLVGTMPIGSLADPAWMLPLSLSGSVAMLVTFGGAVLLPMLRSERKSEGATDASGILASRGEVQVVAASSASRQVASSGLGDAITRWPG